MAAALDNWSTIDSRTGDCPGPRGAAPSRFITWSPICMPPQVARSRVIVHHGLVDTEVTEAQRAYGAYLAASPEHRPDLLIAARHRYHGLVVRACRGEAEPMYEIGRVIGERQTLADLGIDPVEILIGFPEDWAGYLVERHPFGSAELIEALGHRPPNPSGASPLVAALANLGHRTGDTAALEWLSLNAGETERTVAFRQLGQLLLQLCRSLTGHPEGIRADDPDIAALLGRTDSWLVQAGTSGTPADLTRALQFESDNLRWGRARAEGVLLHRQLSECFSRPVAELATWLRAVDHLLRRSDQWVLDYAGVPSLSEVTTGLRAYAQWAAASKSEWGQTRMVSSGFAAGQVLPSFDGTCRNCISQLSGMSYCRQCGTPA